MVVLNISLVWLSVDEKEYFDDKRLRVNKISVCLSVCWSVCLYVCMCVCACARARVRVYFDVMSHAHCLEYWSVQCSVP